MAKRKSTEKQEHPVLQELFEVSVNAINNNKLRWRTRYVMPILLESDKTDLYRKMKDHSFRDFMDILVEASSSYDDIVTHDGLNVYPCRIRLSPIETQEFLGKLIELCNDKYASDKQVETWKRHAYACCPELMLGLQPDEMWNYIRDIIYGAQKVNHCFSDGIFDIGDYFTSKEKLAIVVREIGREKDLMGAIQQIAVARDCVKRYSDSFKTPVMDFNDCDKLISYLSSNVEHPINITFPLQNRHSINQLYNCLQKNDIWSKIVSLENKRDVVCSKLFYMQASSNYYLVMGNGLCEIYKDTNKSDVWKQVKETKSIDTHLIFGIRDYLSHITDYVNDLLLAKMFKDAGYVVKKAPQFKLDTEEYHFEHVNHSKIIEKIDAVWSDNTVLKDKIIDLIMDVEQTALSELRSGMKNRKTLKV